MIEAATGAPSPPDFSGELKRATLARLQSDLREVPGAREFIRRFDALPRCIASSSSMDRLTICLDRLGMAADFAGRVYSADLVERGKPHPDIFLYAARQIGVAPRDCVVIEDSPSGVQAGAAAGMTVVGLCAGAHVREGHARRLRDAGAAFVAHAWSDAADFVQARLRNF